MPTLDEGESDQIVLKSEKSNYLNIKLFAHLAYNLAVLKSCKDGDAKTGFLTR